MVRQFLTVKSTDIFYSVGELQKQVIILCGFVTTSAPVSPLQMVIWFIVETRTRITAALNYLRFTLGYKATK